MRVIYPNEQQASAIAQAMHAVATAGGTIALLPVERESIAAIQRHLLHRDVPIEPAVQTLPANLAEVIDDPTMRREAVRILAMLPVLDQQVQASKVAAVEAAAAALGIEDRGLVILRQALKRQFRRMGFDITRRSVAHYWSPTGKVRLVDWLDMMRIAMPKIPGLWQILTDKTLLEKYRGLAQRPTDTVGYALYRFYVDHGFPIPGEPNSFPEGWAKHEIYHIVGEYDATLQGEMLNAAFSGGNTEYLCMDLLLMTLLQFHAGFQVAPGPVLKGELKPDAFFRAIARGAATNTDFLAGWDHWSVVDLPLEEFRRRIELPPLSAEERVELASYKALAA